jgi:hypothetical protein
MGKTYSLARMRRYDSLKARERACRWGSSLCLEKATVKVQQLCENGSITTVTLCRKHYWELLNGNMVNAIILSAEEY